MATNRKERKARPQSQQSFKWDIAISLCATEMEFTRSLVKALNPKLKVFFYEERQDVLLGKNGIDAFQEALAKEARQVVIIGSENWGKTDYTELERDAIHDRQKESGNDFISVIRLDDDFFIPWYPKSRIYADSRRYGIEEIAHFIEYQQSQLGGEVTPLTLTEKINFFKEREQAHREHLKFLQNPASSDFADRVVNQTQLLINDNIGALDYFSGLKDGLNKREFPLGEIGTENIRIRGAEAEVKVNGLYGLRLILRATRLENFKECALKVNFGISRMVATGQPGKQKLWNVDEPTWYVANIDGQKEGWSQKQYLGSPNPLASADYYLSDLEGTYNLGPVRSYQELLNEHFHWIVDNLEKAYRKIFES